MRRTVGRLVAPWVPPQRGDTKKTVPPPPSSELGGHQGVSERYSDRIAHTPHWKRMAVTDYTERMRENATYYPFMEADPTEYSVQYLPRPFKDPIKNAPLLAVGQAKRIPRVIPVPIVFVCDVYDADGNMKFAKHETVWVRRGAVSRRYLPQRLALIATPEAYRLLGLPVRYHRIHGVIPKTMGQLCNEVARHLWNEEPWRYSYEMMFRQYDAAMPTALLDDAEEVWDENELADIEGAAGGSASEGAGGKKVVRQRKAKKVKLF